MRASAVAAILVALALALAVAGPVAAADTVTEGATPVTVEVGQRLDLCRSGLVATCPLSRSICDDPKVAVVERGEKGAELVGVSAGRTLCAVYGYGGATRRVLQVTVQVPPGTKDQGRREP
jgi:hypothetical protein